MEKNIFIEGIQGSGKSSLLYKLGNSLKDYKVYYEGSLNPVELGWCAYLSNEDYKNILIKYSDISSDIKCYTRDEGKNKVVAYTKIITDIENFHRVLEEKVIHHGNLPWEDFEKIILSRYEKFKNFGNIFEASFFQNTITTMILFYDLRDDEIFNFYNEVFNILKNKNFKLIYLKVDNIEETLLRLKENRTDTRGNKIWFELLNNYIKNSPYGKKYGLENIKGVTSFLYRRMNIELKIVENILGDSGIIVNESYDYEDLLSWVLEEQ